MTTVRNSQTNTAGSAEPAARRSQVTVRQVPKWSQLRPLMQFKGIDPNRTRARLAAAQDVADLRRIARRRTPKAAFEYVDGAASGEHCLRRNREAFDLVEFQPQVLRNVSDVDLSTEILGGSAAMPVGIAPTGFTRMMHTDGEIGGALAAAEHGVPFTLSTMGTTSIEDLAAQAPASRRWFQLYLWKDRRETALELLSRARSAGYDVLVVTVDTAVGGLRLRDRRNGMTIPPQLSLATVLDASYRPQWWINFLTTEPLRFATLTDSPTTTSTIVGDMFDPSVTFEDLAWIRQHWDGPLVLKGIQSADDARRGLDHGADAVYLSNHGGRQLDRAPVPLRLLPQVRAAVGPGVPLIVDSGIMSGADVLAALALGADFTMVGRAYLYGLMAGGGRGVDRMLQMVRQEMQVTLQLLGLTSVRQLRPEHVRLDWRAPR